MITYPVLGEYIRESSAVHQEKERAQNTALCNSMFRSHHARKMAITTDALCSVDEVRLDPAMCVTLDADSMQFHKKDFVVDRVKRCAEIE